MMPRPLARSMASRSPGTRTSRKDTRQRQIESLAAEFALLAQRRARQSHQVELLEQQLLAARRSFARLQRRLSWLVEQMDALDPSLRPGLEAPPEPIPPPAPAVARTGRTAAARGRGRSSPAGAAGRAAMGGPAEQDRPAAATGQVARLINRETDDEHEHAGQSR
jgi:uncharacterized coiled-coil protein SlyX